MKVIKSLRAPVLVTLVLLLICGLIYPVVMTLMSQAIFPSQANGSIIYVDGQAVGAKNVGQDFTDPPLHALPPLRLPVQHLYGG